MADLIRFFDSSQFRRLLRAHSGALSNDWSLRSRHHTDPTLCSECFHSLHHESLLERKGFLLVCNKFFPQSIVSELGSDIEHLDKEKTVQTAIPWNTHKPLTKTQKWEKISYIRRLVNTWPNYKIDSTIMISTFSRFLYMSWFCYFVTYTQITTYLLKNRACTLAQAPSFLTSWKVPPTQHWIQHQVVNPTVSVGGCYTTLIHFYFIILWGITFFAFELKIISELLAKSILLASSDYQTLITSFSINIAPITKIRPTNLIYNIIETRHIAL